MLYQLLKWGLIAWTASRLFQGKPIAPPTRTTSPVDGVAPSAYSFVDFLGDGKDAGKVMARLVKDATGAVLAFYVGDKVSQALIDYPTSGPAKITTIDTQQQEQVAPELFRAIAAGSVKLVGATLAQLQGK